ncbi:MAG: hypothetical protein IH945_08235 [Armatimonadetes bacterium]|nr:hypothetical protein [Armatimonadota bacterium]
MESVVKTDARVSALAAVVAVLAIGCGGSGSGQVSFSGALLENYLAVADDGTAHLVEYEVSQGFLSSDPFSSLPEIEDAVVYDGTLSFVASKRGEPTLMTATYDGTDLVGLIREFPVAGATTIGAVGYDEWQGNVFVVADGSTVKMYKVGPAGNLTGGTTVLAGLPLIRDLIVASSGLYVVTDQTVFAYTLTGTGLPVLFGTLFAHKGIVSFKLSRGGPAQAAYLLTGGNILRTYNVDFFGALIPINSIDLSFDLLKFGRDIAPFSSDACLVSTVDGEAIAVLRGLDGRFSASFSVFLDGAGNTRSIEVDFAQSRLLVTDESGTVRGYLLLSDGDIGAVTADTSVSVGVPVRTSFFSSQFVQ